MKRIERDVTTIQSQISRRCFAALSLLLPLEGKRAFLIPSLVFWHIHVRTNPHYKRFKKAHICCRGKQQDSTQWHLYFKPGSPQRCQPCAYQAAVGGVGGFGSMTGTELILAAAAGSGVLVGKREHMLPASARSACEVEPESTILKGAYYNSVAANQANGLNDTETTLRKHFTLHSSSILTLPDCFILCIFVT